MTRPAAIRTLARWARRLACSRLARFLCEGGGVAAVEFALILPVMLLMYLGTVEVGNAVSANRKVVATASTIGDLAAQSSSIDDPTMSNIFAASSAVIEPFSASPLQLRISQIMIDANSKAWVSWSDAQNISALSKGQAFTGLPSNLTVANTYLIYSEVKYAYSSPVGQLIAGTLTMGDTFYLRPRVGTCVQRNGSC